MIKIMKLVFIMLLISNIAMSQALTYTLRVLIITNSHEGGKTYKEYTMNIKQTSNSDIQKEACKFVSKVDFERIQNGLYKKQYQKGEITCIVSVLAKTQELL